MYKLYWIALASIFYISACTKIENTDIGTGLIPPVDGVTTLDTTLDVFTNNYLNPLADSMKVYKTDDHVIGVINDDPLFGKTTASAFFELKPTNYKFSFPNKPSVIADSAVLILSYKGAWGDTMTHQKWQVREVNEAMRGDTVFSTSTSFSAGGKLRSLDFDADITQFDDSVNYGFENANNQIRIKLDKGFAERLILQFDSTANGAYESDSIFRERFRGFAVVPAPGSPGNALIRINLADTNTKLALFYSYKKTDTSTTRDTTVSYFRFNNENSSAITVSANANHIVRNYSGSQFTNYFSNTNRNDSLVFIQTAPGSFTTIKIPGLRELPNAIIHRAELLAFEESTSTPAPNSTILTPPRYLLLRGYDSTAKKYFNVPNDFALSAETQSNIETFGGYLSQKMVPGLPDAVYAYTFDLSRYVQGIVTRKDSSYTLHLSAPSNDSLQYTPPYPGNTTTLPFYIAPDGANNIANGRVRLGGGGLYKENPVRMRLRIIYSKI